MTEPRGPSDSVLRRIEGFARTSHDSGYEQGYVDAHREVRRALARRSLVYLLLGLLLGGTIMMLAAQRGMLGETFAPRAPDPVDLGVGRGLRYREAAEFARDYTVAIRTARTARWMGTVENVGSGSGFFLDSDGHIVTNRHVIQNATRFEVIWRGLRYTAEPVGHHLVKDVAVLRINADGINPAPTIGEGERPFLAEEVLAVGAPFGLEHSVTQGIVSYVNRRMSPTDGPYIQTDCAINPGNSGGPLVNLQGRVVGMNRMILTQSGDSAGIALAIPIDDVKKAAAEIISGAKAKGYTPQLGKQTGERVETAYIGLIVDLSYRNSMGVMVGSVIPGGPAGEAGVLRGDVIIGIDELPVRDRDELSALLASSFQPGQTCKLRVLRDGREVILSIVLSGIRVNN